MSKTLESWKREVKAIQSYLDESYNVSSFDLTLPSSFSKIRLPWGKVVIEKFCDRIVPLISGGRATKASQEIIEQWIEQAVSFGNASLIVTSEGETRIPSPLHSFSQKSGSTPIFYEELEGGGILVGEGSTLYFSEERIGTPLFEPQEIADAEIFTIFYEQKNTLPYGQSRLSPAIREQIHFASKVQLYIQAVSHEQSFTQLVLTNLAQDVMNAYSAREKSPSALGNIAEIQTGVRKALLLAQNDSGASVGVDAIDPTDPSGLIKVFERTAANIASSRNLEPRDLGNTSAVAPSAEAQYAAKEDLAIEIKNFERSIHAEVLSALYAISYANGEDDPRLEWANPATPSEASMMDAFIKLVGAVPAARYSRKAMLAHGFSPELVDELLGDAFENILPLVESVEIPVEEAENELT